MGRKSIKAKGKAPETGSPVMTLGFPKSLMPKSVKGKRKARETGGEASTVTWQWVINFIAPLISIILPALSEALREQITAALVKWKALADKTPNPWDNFLVTFIAALVGVKL